MSAKRLKRPAFIFSLDAFFALVLIGATFVAGASFLSAQERFHTSVSTLARIELAEDILSSWQESGRIYELSRPLGANYYSNVLAEIEEKTGENFCLYLDGMHFYRMDCRPVICAKRFFGQANALGQVEFRKAELCISDSYSKGVE